MLVEPAVPWTQARGARDSWSTLQALGASPESAGRAGHPRSSSDPGLSRLGQLIAPSSARKPDQLGWDSRLSRCLLGPGTESAGRALPPPSSSGPRLSRPRRLVDPKALRIRVLGGRDSWSTRGTLAPGPIWPGTRVEPTSAHTRDASVGRAGRPQGSSDREPRRPGALSDPASARTRDQMIQERWSTLCTPGPGTASGGMGQT